MSASKKQPRLAIIGGGESGVGAAVLGKKKGWDVFLSDRGKLNKDHKKVLSNNRINYEEGKHTASLILNAQEVVKSPGVPEKAPIVRMIRKNRIPIISEIEWGARFTDATLIGITGTNGKTTTASLVYHLLKKAGYKVRLGGNIGKSFSALVSRETMKNKPRYYVLELSSFQLDGMTKTKIDIAVLTNITSDHLDSYEYKMKNYINSKFRITQNQDKNSAFIFCADDPVIRKELKKRKLKARLFPYSIDRKVKQGAYEKDRIINININKQKPIQMFVEQLALQGRHNLYNSMAAGIAARLVDVKKSVIRESLSDFQNIEHRLEFVSRVHGVNYINDSKATNVNSTWFALESMDKPTVWIVGGVDKGNNYKMLLDLVDEKIKAIVCLGVDNKKIKKAFKGKVEMIIETQSAKDAVRAASRLANKGDNVLLSPCCSSFDLFENYEDRGRQFKKAVKAL